MDLSMAEKNSPLTIAEAILEKTNNQNRGKLKLFLGAAPGVGKTYAMLTEAHEMLKEGLRMRCSLSTTSMESSWTSTCAKF